MILLLILIFILFQLLNFKEKFISQEQNKYYINLKENWSSIFPDGNRNSAGPKFFKYILDLNLNYNDFLEYNKLYCAVSGSLVDPNSKPDKVYLKEVSSGNLICGDYYRCCWPCSCDLMKYAQVIKYSHNFKDGLQDIYLLVINNPCKKNNFPNEVNKDYFCKNNLINNNEVFEVNDKLVIGLLHNANKCSDSNILDINNNNITGNMCSQRNAMDLDDLNFGMGDIFIKLAK